MNGRRREVFVDTQWVILEDKANEANLSDKEGGALLLENLDPNTYLRMKKLRTDPGYSGFDDWVHEQFGWDLEVKKQASNELVTIAGDDGKPKEVPVKAKGFQVIL